MFIAVLFAIAKTWRQPTRSLTDVWMKSIWYLYTMEYYLVIKNNERIAFAATWMDLDVLILSKACKKENDKYHIIPHKCGI